MTRSNNYSSDLLYPELSVQQLAQDELLPQHQEEEEKLGWSSPTDNSLRVRYSAKSHFTLSDGALWDLNVGFALCSGTPSASSKGTNVHLHPQSLP